MYLGDRLTVGHRPLEAGIGVRIPVPQQKNRIAVFATASLHSATPKKNVLSFFKKNFTTIPEKQGTFFFGVLPSRSRAGGGTMRTKFWQNYFLGKGFAKTSAHLFLNSEVANGIRGGHHCYSIS